MRREGLVNPEGLAALARLSRFQVQGAAMVPSLTEPWIYGIQVPATLTPRVRRLLGMPGGLSWSSVGPEDRVMLTRRLRRPDYAAQYTARAGAGIVEAPGQGGTQLSLQVHAEWGVGQGTSLFYLPLPGLNRSLQPKPASLQVKLER